MCSEEVRQIMYELKQQLMMALRHSTDLFIRTRDQHCRSIWASRCSSLARLSLSRTARSPEHRMIRVH